MARAFIDALTAAARQRYFTRRHSMPRGGVAAASLRLPSPISRRADRGIDTPVSSRSACRVMAYAAAEMRAEHAARRRYHGFAASMPRQAAPDTQIAARSLLPRPLDRHRAIGPYRANRRKHRNAVDRDVGPRHPW